MRYARHQKILELINTHELDTQERLAEKLRDLLRRESKRNRLGVSLTYLKHLSGNPEDARLRRILKTAPWAREQYGLFLFVDAELYGQNAQAPQAELPPVDEKDDQDQDRDRDDRDNDSCQHGVLLYSPPKRLLRRAYSAMAALMSFSPKSGQSVSVKTSSL